METNGALGFTTNDTENHTFSSEVLIPTIIPADGDDHKTSNEKQQTTINGQEAITKLSSRAVITKSLYS